MLLKWRDIIMPNAANVPVETKSADDVAREVIAKTGITFVKITDTGALDKRADAAPKDGEAYESI